VVAHAGARNRVVMVPAEEYAEAHNRREGVVSMSSQTEVRLRRSLVIDG
jgi:hypothetical protein